VMRWRGLLLRDDGDQSRSTRREILFCESFEVFFGDGVDIAGEGAGPVEALGLGVGVPKDAGEPVAVVSQHLAEHGELRLPSSIMVPPLARSSPRVRTIEPTFASCSGFRVMKANM
jgi:hypothetical protein